MKTFVLTVLCGAITFGLLRAMFAPAVVVTAQTPAPPRVVVVNQPVQAGPQVEVKIGKVDPPAPPEAPKAKTSRTVSKPAEPPVKFTIVSEPYFNAEDARKGGLAQARELLKEKAGVSWVPSEEQIWADYVRKDSVKEIAENDPQIVSQIGREMVKTEFVVELNAAQLREVRAESRQMSGFKLLGGMVAVLLGFTGFFKLDEWTKGYLTTLLGIGAAVFVGATLAIILAS
jgi:hypothetical protein